MRKKSTPSQKDHLQDSENHGLTNSDTRRRFSNLPENYENDEYEGIDSIYTSDDDGMDDLDREPELEELNPNVEEEDFDIPDDDDEF